jgi:hypothetical protein
MHAISAILFFIIYLFYSRIYRWNLKRKDWRLTRSSRILFARSRWFFSLIIEIIQRIIGLRSTTALLLSNVVLFPFRDINRPHGGTNEWGVPLSTWISRESRGESHQTWKASARTVRFEGLIKGQRWRQEKKEAFRINVAQYWSKR